MWAVDRKLMIISFVDGALDEAYFPFIQLIFQRESRGGGRNLFSC
jgi:hypothetical protein